MRRIFSASPGHVRLDDVFYMIQAQYCHRLSHIRIIVLEGRDDY